MGNNSKICPPHVSSNSGHPQGKNRCILEGTGAFSYNFVCNANQLHLIHVMEIQNGKYSTKVAVWLSNYVTTCNMFYKRSRFDVKQRRRNPCTGPEGSRRLSSNPRHRVSTNCTGVLISAYPDQEGNKLQRQKILMFIYPIYNHK